MVTVIDDNNMTVVVLGGGGRTGVCGDNSGRWGRGGVVGMEGDRSVVIVRESLW